MDGLIIDQNDEIKVFKFYDPILKVFIIFVVN